MNREKWLARRKRIADAKAATAIKRKLQTQAARKVRRQQFPRVRFSRLLREQPSLHRMYRDVVDGQSRSVKTKFALRTPYRVRLIIEHERAAAKHRREIKRAREYLTNVDTPFDYGQAKLRIKEHTAEIEGIKREVEGLWDELRGTGEWDEWLKLIGQTLA